MYRISKSKPIPEKTYGKRQRRTERYPFSEMESGHSFLVRRGKRTDRELTRLAASVGVCAYMWLKKNRPGWRRIIRTNKGGVRCWFVNENGQPQE